jgi:hypothetical protein
MGVAIVGLLGLYIRSRHETGRLHKEIDEDHLKHRMGVYHNVLVLARQIVSGEREGYQVQSRSLHERFCLEVDGLAVFGASEPRRIALEMVAVLNRAIPKGFVANPEWLEKFEALRDEFMDATHEDVGPDDPRGGHRT